jgi:aminoglycoside 6'-N-acetyltransferase
MPDPTMTFRPLIRDDLGMLRSWLEAPHVRRWWHGERTDAVIAAVEDGNSVDTAWIAENGNQSLGYIRGYWAKDHANGLWRGVENVTDTTRALDFLIGDPGQTNRKLGRAMIRGFVTRLFEDPGVDRVVADPARDNWPANIALKRVGFRDRGRIAKPGVNAMLLTLARGVFKP